MIRRLALLLLIVLLSSPLWILVLVLEGSPQVLDTTSLSVNDMENAKRLLGENDPRRLRDGERRRVALTQRELNLLFRYLLPEPAAAHIALVPDLLTVAASLPIPNNPLGSWLNTELILVSGKHGLEPIALRAGALSLPGWMAAGLHALAEHLLLRRVPEYAAALESLESLEIGEGSLEVSYRWRAEFLEQLKNRGQQLVVSPELREGILAYYTTLERVSRTLPAGASLVQVLNPLFVEAARRSKNGVRAQDEHRALLLALGMAFRHSNPNRLTIDGEAPVAIVRGLPVTLAGRHDLAQHFVISAALAAGGGSRLADAMGVFKELSDSRGGSGFSFPDLLADRSGVVFAEQATGPAAPRIQRMLAQADDESLFMPPIDQLPEGLQDPEFRRRYEDLDTQAYNRVRGEVEQRIVGLALYRY
jgi:hypothetical protein